MKLFYGRPLCFGCVGGVAAAFLCARYGSTAALFTGVSAFVLALLSALLIKPRRRIDRRLYFVLFFSLICAVSLSSSLYFSDKDGYLTDEQVFIVGYLDPSYVSGNKHAVRVTNLNGKPVDVLMCADLSYYTPPYEYAKFSAYGSVSKIGGEDSLYLKGKGIFFKTELTRLSFNGTQRGLKYRIDSVRDYVARRFYSVSDRGDLYNCLFLGRRSLAPDGVSSDFRSLGITHMLAVSGLHVAAMLAGAEFVMSRLFGKRKFVFVILSVSALFYMALAGFSGSVVRAAIMYFIMISGRLFSMRSDSITGLSLAVYIILFASPYAVYDVGFLLSASATAGIILIGAPAARALAKRADSKNGAVKALLYVAGSFAVTLSALVFTLPVAAVSYGKVVFVSLLANLLVAPLIMILLYACPYLFLLSFIPYAGRFAGAFCDGATEIVERLAHALTRLPPLSVSVKYDFVKYMIAVFALAAVALVVAGVRKRRFYTALCLLFAVAFISGAMIFNGVFAKKDVLIMQSSDKGELIALCSGGKCTVFDLSEGADAYGLSETLLKYGFTNVDCVCAAHFSSYHIQSIPAACRALGVRSLTLPDTVGARLCAELCGKNAEFYDASAESSFVCGRVIAVIDHAEYQSRVYTRARFGGAAYSDGLPVYREKLAIYGSSVLDAAAASVSADTVYLPESFKNNDEISEYTEFYGDIAVIELK